MTLLSHLSHFVSAKKYHRVLTKNRKKWCCQKGGKGLWRKGKDAQRYEVMKWTSYTFKPSCLFQYILFYKHIQGRKSFWNFIIDISVWLVHISKYPNICPNDGLKDFSSSSFFKLQPMSFPDSFWCVFFRSIKGLSISVLKCKSESKKRALQSCLVGKCKQLTC